MDPATKSYHVRFVPRDRNAATQFLTIEPGAARWTLSSYIAAKFDSVDEAVKFAYKHQLVLRQAHQGNYDVVHSDTLEAVPYSEFVMMGPLLDAAGRKLLLEERNAALREASGSFTTTCAVTSFIYELLRDHVPVVTVEKILRNTPANYHHLLTNGWLALYAQNVANTLLGRGRLISDDGKELVIQSASSSGNLFGGLDWKKEQMVEEEKHQQTCREIRDNQKAVVAEDQRFLDAVNQKLSQDDAVRELAAKSNQFAEAVYRGLDGSPKKDALLAPASLFTSLAMLSLGTDSNTLVQLERVLGMPLDEKAKHAEFGGLRSRISEGVGPNTLLTANRLFVDKNLALKPEFCDAASLHYKATAAACDFNRPIAVEIKICEWVKKVTCGKIKNAVGYCMLDTNSCFVMADAIYFKGEWASKFDVKNTSSAPFFLPSGRSVPTPTMYQLASLPYGDSGGWQMLELPYRHSTLSMVIALPFGQAGHDAPPWSNARRLESVRVFLPKFTIMSAFNLKPVLRAIGITDLFDHRTADFSAMTTHRVWLHEVLHSTVLEVDENGTEAAGATLCVGTQGSQGPDDSKIFNANRPFEFIIQDNVTSCVLFRGRFTGSRITLEER